MDKVRMGRNLKIPVPPLALLQTTPGGGDSPQTSDTSELSEGWC